MNLLTLLDMVAAGHGDRLALGTAQNGLTGEQLRDQAYAGASQVTAQDIDTVVFMGENGPAFPLALFAAAAAGVPLLPLNYRLAREQLHDAVARQGRTLLISDDTALADLGNVVRAIGLRDWTELCAGHPPTPAAPVQPDPDEVAVLLLTSGTTAAPKSAVLRHRHLAAYVLGSVEFGAADADEAVIVSVPPYHIAAVANLLSNLYSGRRVVYLETFTATAWLETVAAERVTHAMLVPTMLARIVDELERGDTPAPTTLRSLSYGGARLPSTVLERALTLLPGTGFVNAYGLTETSSSVAVLGPEDHRRALDSEDPDVRARLGSVGRPLPSVAIEIRDEAGQPCPPGAIGMIYVKGAQVAGEYRESGPVTDADGWFATRDEGHLDAEGYLFVRGRADDTIIRGGENIAPAEIEAVLQRHPDVRDAAVVGIPDEEWGQRIGAFIVLKPGASATEDGMRAFVRQRLRSSKTPDAVHFLDELPHTPTGKVLRRELLAQAPQPA
ncbi:class I adenylate-forming enzyme family protein [Peterkaempfera bronchialis]|uniref:class I adenylate-forming enzyme family protein n=1 Tax=Peterkaempfera bronchialis TaxID=2126346 RepID=UPI003C2AD4DB